MVLSHKKKIWTEQGFKVKASTIYEAELLALIASLEYIVDEFGFNWGNKRNLEVYGDSKDVIEDLSNESKAAENLEMINKLKQMLEKNGYINCKFTWIPRTHNFYADHISKQAKKYGYRNEKYVNVGGDFNVKQMEMLKNLGIKTFEELKWKE